MNERALRSEVVTTARAMAPNHLNRGAAGNVSVRADEGGAAGFLVTPTGMAYERLTAADIPFVRLDSADTPSYTGLKKPSSEWRLHRDLYRARPEARAILHAHAPFATSLACLRHDIPPFHYMIARFGGDSIRCAAYATFGTQALSDNMLQAMEGRSACLLANHGMVVAAASLGEALDRAIEFESLCEQYWRACQMGEPVLLNEAEMADALARFATYGRQD
jgi:L-fuculose-phosphate aldolase